MAAILKICKLGHYDIFQPSNIIFVNLCGFFPDYRYQQGLYESVYYVSGTMCVRNDPLVIVYCRQPARICITCTPQCILSRLFQTVCGGGQGVPNPRFPPLPPLPSPSPPPRFPPSHHPTSLPLEYFSRPHRKKKKSSHHITFHFSAWIIIKALRL